ncbi:MAG: SDR family NAD(P)-dependent oxidoreductase [bacterium]
MKDAERGQFAVITGASSGIGLELAKQFAQHGFDVLLAAEDDRLGDAAHEVRNLGVQVEAVKVNLATREGVDMLYQRIQALGRPVDAIALNAGVGVGGAFVDNDLEAELDMIALNVTGVVHLAKHVVKDMVARNEGRILFTASVVAEMPGPFLAVYAASKAFVLSFAEAIRNELEDTNVVVTALQPGVTDTDFYRRAGMEGTKVGDGAKSDPADVARAGFEALMKGKDHVVAGSFKEKVLVVLGQVAPETTKAEMLRKQTEPGSAGA